MIIGGVVHDLNRKITQKGDERLNFYLEDLTDKIRVLVNEKITKEKKSLFEENMLFMVRGRLNFYDENPVVNLESIITLDEAYDKLGKFLHIRLREIGLEEMVAQEINNIILQNKGDAEVILHVLTKDNKEMIGTLADGAKVKVTEELLQQLESIVGEDNLWLSWKK